MEKKTIKEKIHEKYYSGFPDIRMSELPTDLLPTDIIEIDRVEPFYSDNNSWDAHTYVIVYRERLETDEEFEKRLLNIEENKKASKQLRYQNYLKLKKEFETE